jgi:hypothetical protein
VGPCRRLWRNPKVYSPLALLCLDSVRGHELIGWVGFQLSDAFWVHAGCQWGIHGCLMDYMIRNSFSKFWRFSADLWVEWFVVITSEYVEVHSYIVPIYWVACT